MAVNSISSDNKIQNRPGDDIVSSAKPATDFSQTKSKGNVEPGALNAFLLMNWFNQIDHGKENMLDLPESFDRYIDENFEVKNNVEITVDGVRVNAENFYDKNTDGADYSDIPGTPSTGGRNFNLDGFIPQVRGSNISADGSFQQSFAIVVASEGGFSNHKADRGGATIFGVASRANPAEYRQIMARLNAGDREGAMEITMETYKKKYWDAAGIGNIDDPEARLVAFDAAINHGAGYARRMIRNTGEDAEAMLRYRSNTYLQIVENNPSQRVFLNGWRNRLAKLDSIIDNDAAPSVQMAARNENSNSERRSLVASTEINPSRTSDLGRSFHAADAIRTPASVVDQIADAGRSAMDRGREMLSNLPKLEFRPPWG